MPKLGCTLLCLGSVSDYVSILSPIQATSAPMPRDFYMTTKDLSNRRAVIDRETWKYHINEPESVRIFAQQHPENVLRYTEAGKDSSGTEVPFQLALTTKELIERMVKFGHGGVALLDSTFATNNKKVRPLLVTCTFDNYSLKQSFASYIIHTLVPDAMPDSL